MNYVKSKEREREKEEGKGNKKKWRVPIQDADLLSPSVGSKQGSTVRSNCGKQISKWSMYGWIVSIYIIGVLHRRHNRLIICYAMLCYAMLCYAMLCYAIPYCSYRCAKVLAVLEDNRG